MFLKMRYLPDLLKLQKISVATCPENEGAYQSQNWNLVTEKFRN